MNISYIENHSGHIARTIRQLMKAKLAAYEKSISNSMVGSLARDNINSQIGSNIGDKTIGEFSSIEKNAGPMLNAFTREAKKRINYNVPKTRVKTMEEFEREEYERLNLLTNT